MAVAPTASATTQADPIRRAALLLLRQETEREGDALLRLAREAVDALVPDAPDTELLETAQMKNLYTIGLHHRLADIQTYVFNQQGKATPGRGWASEGLGDKLGDYLAATLDEVAARMTAVMGRARKRLEAMFPGDARRGARHEAIEAADEQLEGALRLVRTYLRHFTVYYDLRAGERRAALKGG